MLSYQTSFGSAFLAESLSFLRQLPSQSVDLFLTSPPFPLVTQKDYGNVAESEYLDWLSPFTEAAYQALKPSGSLVIDLGGVYQRGRPYRSLYPYRFLLRLCDVQGFRLAQEFYWYNPSKLPAPVEWVNVRKIRVKDSVNTLWWLGKTDSTYSDSREVLVPYSERMKELIKKGDSFLPKHPSGWEISSKMSQDRGGALPSSLLTIPNTTSRDPYLKECRKLGIPIHPARFPKALPEFFIKFLTKPGETVCDFFAGSNMTGFVAEGLQRRWISIEQNKNYWLGSFLRFSSGKSPVQVEEEIQKLKKDLVSS